MSQEAVELVVAAFQAESGAENALKLLEATAKERPHGIQNSVVIQRDANNTLHIRENVSASGTQAIAGGTVLGGSIGLLFPPSILSGGLLGATIRDLAARLRENGFPEARFNELGASLLPGTSAILALVPPERGADLEREFSAHDAKVVREKISAELAVKLEQRTDPHTVATKSPAPVEPEKERVQATNGELAAASSQDSNSIHKE